MRLGKSSRLKSPQRERVDGFGEAEEVIIELDDTWYTKTPMRRKYLEELALNYPDDTRSPAKPLDEIRKQNLETILSTVAQRMKQFFLWRVYHEGEIDRAPAEIFLFAGESIPSLPIKVKETKPLGEVQITPKTKVTAVLRTVY